MHIPAWLILGVGVLICVWGAYRIRIAFRSDEEDRRARERKGLFAMGRRTHLLIGIVYLLLGGALIATSFGWNPVSGILRPGDDAPSKKAVPGEQAAPSKQAAPGNSAPSDPPPSKN